MTKEQVIDLINWMPDCGWQLVATLGPLPAPGSIVRMDIVRWLRGGEEIINSPGDYITSLQITEIAKSHVYPLVYLLIGDIGRGLVIRPD